MTTPKEPEGAEPMARSKPEDLAVLTICQMDPRWERMSQAQRQTWLKNSRRGGAYACAVAAIEARDLELSHVCAALKEDVENQRGRANGFRLAADQALAKVAALEKERDAAREALRAANRVLLPLRMELAYAELGGVEIPGNSVALSFMGGGGSDQVTVAEIREALSTIESALSSPSSSAAKPETR